MNNKNKIVSLFYVALAVMIVLVLMFLLLMVAHDKWNDEHEIDTPAIEPSIDTCLVAETDTVEESKEPEPTDSVAEDDCVEIEEIKYPFTERYKDVEVTKEDIDLMAAVVHHEAGNQCLAGQRMVAEVILNRVVQGDMGGKTIREVICAKNQFFNVKDSDIAKADEGNYMAVYIALCETPITDDDVVYFAMQPYNNHVFCKIEDHYFCYKK